MTSDEAGTRIALKVGSQLAIILVDRDALEAFDAEMALALQKLEARWCHLTPPRAAFHRSSPQASESA